MATHRRILHNSIVSRAWFALGLVLTTATQLRPGGSGVGVGEVLLAGWMVVSFVVMAAQRQLDTTGLPKVLLAFWIVALGALTSGYLLHPAPWDRVSVTHDARALAFAALLLVAFVTPDGTVARFRHTLSLVLALSLGPLFVLWVVALLTPSLGPLTLWYPAGPHRFAGWAENPNQLALLATAAPFMCLHLASVSRGGGRGCMVCLAGAGSVIGLATYSDALRVCWLAGALYLIAAASRRVWMSGRSAISVAALVVTLGVSGAILGPFTLEAGVSAEMADMYRALFEEGDQASVRWHAWSRGMEAVQASPLFGSGPGAYAGEPMVLESVEAHNTFVDWAASSGIVGLTAYLVVLGWIALRLLRGPSAWLSAAFLALNIFSLFNYVFRQPLFWFLLLAVAALASAPPSNHGTDRAPVGRGRRVGGRASRRSGGQLGTCVA